MNRVVVVEAHFKQIGKYVTKKVPTGEVKPGLFGGDKQVMKSVSVWQQTGISDCEIDVIRLNNDIAEAVEILNREQYEVISITPITSGKYDYSYRAALIEAKGYGYGYGYSHTEGVIILAKQIGR